MAARRASIISNSRCSRGGDGGDRRDRDSHTSIASGWGSSLIRLPRWMTRALLATSAMNAFGAFAFTPWGAPLRALVGLPADAHALYLLVIASFIGLFGLGYLYTGLTERADPLFIAIAGAGKLTFFGLLAVFWSMGELPIRAPLAAVGDLVFGAMFVAWLAGNRAAGGE